MGNRTTTPELTDPTDPYQAWGAILTKVFVEVVPTVPELNQFFAGMTGEDDESQRLRDAHVSLLGGAIISVSKGGNVSLAHVARWHAGLREMGATEAHYDMTMGAIAAGAGAFDEANGTAHAATFMTHYEPIAGAVKAAVIEGIPT